MWISFPLHTKTSGDVVLMICVRKPRKAVRLPVNTEQKCLERQKLKILAAESRVQGSDLFSKFTKA